MLGFFVCEPAGIQIRHGISNNPSERVDACGAGAVIPGFRPPQRARLLVPDSDALSVFAVTIGTVLSKENFAFGGIKFFNWNQLGRGDCILPPPRRIVADFGTASEPGDVGGESHYFFG